MKEFLIILFFCTGIALGLITKYHWILILVIFILAYKYFKLKVKIIDLERSVFVANRMTNFMDMIEKNYESEHITGFDPLVDSGDLYMNLSDACTQGKDSLKKKLADYEKEGIKFSNIKI